MNMDNPLLHRLQYQQSPFLSSHPTTSPSPDGEADRIHHSTQSCDIQSTSDTPSSSVVARATTEVTDDMNQTFLNESKPRKAFPPRSAQAFFPKPSPQHTNGTGRNQRHETTIDCRKSFKKDSSSLPSPQVTSNAARTNDTIVVCCLPNAPVPAPDYLSHEPQKMTDNVSDNGFTQKRLSPHKLMVPGKPKMVEPFPEKLHRMLREVEAAGHDDIVSFVGQVVFCIHKPHQFFQELLPLYFSQSRSNSFQRILKQHGFVFIQTTPFLSLDPSRTLTTSSSTSTTSAIPPTFAQDDSPFSNPFCIPPRTVKFLNSSELCRGCFYHEHFVKGDPDRATRIKRTFRS